MKHMSPDYDVVVRALLSLPRQILAGAHREHVTESVLHHLCDPGCLNLTKAAYFVDNPAFDCLQGIAGYDTSESHPQGEKIWQEPELFDDHLASCSYNSYVKTITVPSKRLSKEDQEIVIELAPQLKLSAPTVVSWDLKHDNHAFLFFELSENQELDPEMLHAFCLLGFCPLT